MLATPANALVRPTPDMTLKAALVAVAGNNMRLGLDFRFLTFKNSVLIPESDGTYTYEVNVSSIRGSPTINVSRDKKIVSQKLKGKFTHL